MSMEFFLLLSLLLIQSRGIGVTFYFFPKLYHNLWWQNYSLITYLLSHFYISFNNSKNREYGNKNVCATKLILSVFHCMTKSSLLGSMILAGVRRHDPKTVVVMQFFGDYGQKEWLNFWWSFTFSYICNRVFFLGF